MLPMNSFDAFDEDFVLLQSEQKPKKKRRISEKKTALIKAVKKALRETDDCFPPFNSDDEDMFCRVESFVKPFLDNPPLKYRAYCCPFPQCRSYCDDKITEKNMRDSMTRHIRERHGEYQVPFTDIDEFKKRFIDEGAVVNLKFFSRGVKLATPVRLYLTEDDFRPPFNYYVIVEKWYDSYILDDDMMVVVTESGNNNNKTNFMSRATSPIGFSDLILSPIDLLKMFLSSYDFRDLMLLTDFHFYCFRISYPNNRMVSFHFEQARLTFQLSFLVEKSDQSTKNIRDIDVYFGSVCHLGTIYSNAIREKFFISFNALTSYIRLLHPECSFRVR
jgi:hypothetical protein